MERGIKYPPLLFVYSCGILSFFVDYYVRKVKLMSLLLEYLLFLFVRTGWSKINRIFPAIINFRKEKDSLS